MPCCRGLPCMIVVFLVQFLGLLSSQDCDVIIDRSLDSIPQQGTFHSPGWPQHYPTNTHCIYKFIGTPNERVSIKFSFFDIQGVLPLCRFDYMDIYAQVTSPTQSLLDTPLLGRFCDSSLSHLPKLVISTSNILVLDFYSDDKTTDAGFNGSFTFIDASVYDIGTQTDPQICNYTINGVRRPSGFILSPTYPGFYPDRLHCNYLLQGAPGQRIHIKFLDFALYHGGDYCPFDYVKVRDGRDRSAAIIGTFCGSYKDVEFYSSQEFLYIEFVTSSGRVDLESTTLDNNVDFAFDRKGFKISYQFSSSFVNLDDMNEGHIQHVVGTECDVKIVSKKGSNGTVRSPGYPRDYPINVTCRYILDGMSNPLNSEKVMVAFTDFELSGSMTSGVMTSCTRGHLLVEGHKDNNGSEKFCGSLFPPNLHSKDSRMVLTLDTHGAFAKRGFSANFEFIIDCGIPGDQPDPNQCIFVYDGKKKKSGAFNSPRHSWSSPKCQQCNYIFRPEATEKLLISFDTFSLGTHNSSCLNTDYLEIYVGTGRSRILLNRYCGQHYPAPIIGQQNMEIVYHARSRGGNSKFQAHFEYLNDNQLHSRCGRSIISSGGGGILKSPGSPGKYTNRVYCKWTIRAKRKSSRIMVHLYEFRIEGRMTGVGYVGAGIGCQNAVMKLYNGSSSPPMELCGTLSDDTTYLSVDDTMELEFLTSGRSLGGKGFEISWTEIHSDLGGTCYGFVCSKTKYCIGSEMKCNKMKNCGKGDNSDETTGCNPETEEQASSSGPAVGKFEILHIAIGASISSFFCIILVICGLYHRRKFRPDRKPPANDHVEVRYVAAASSCNTTDRLLTMDQNDGRTTIVTSPHQTPSHTANQISKSSNPGTPGTPPVNPGTPVQGGTPNQTPNFSNANRTNNRAPRIQKVSIV
ncbi:tolloid-like protein 1 isoform X1 [Argopecten irradians]|uniref:tolloid-like protein 1 isoform X1 n=1 Tax=Argopecten irradians TaxID=31199 RepID=UPI003723EB50